MRRNTTNTILSFHISPGHQCNKCLVPSRAVIAPICPRRTPRAIKQPSKQVTISVMVKHPINKGTTDVPTWKNNLPPQLVSSAGMSSWRRRLGPTGHRFIVGGDVCRAPFFRSSFLSALVNFFWRGVKIVWDFFLGVWSFLLNKNVSGRQTLCQERKCLFIF